MAIDQQAARAYHSSQQDLVAELKRERDAAETALREWRDLTRSLQGASAVDTGVVGPMYERIQGNVDRVLAAADKRPASPKASQDLEGRS